MYPESKYKARSRNPNRNTLQNNWPGLLRSVKAMKDKDRISSRVKETQEKKTDSHPGAGWLFLGRAGTDGETRPQSADALVTVTVRVDPHSDRGTVAM